MTPSTTTIASVQTRLVSWYNTSRRRLPWRDNPSPYRIWISEVMLQQTQVKTVIPYYLRFMAAYPDVRELARADLESLLKSWEGLGYYARARNLHKAANILVHEMEAGIPEDFDRFISLPGVGDYIASAVMSIAFGHAHAVVDGNVKRVLARLFLMETPVNNGGGHRRFKAAATRLLDKADPGRFNQALMELGALVCTPRSPACPDCPLADQCLACSTGRTGLFPVRVPKKKVPVHHIAVGIVRNRDRVLITRRPLSGLLGGLWEFPGGKVEEGETPDQACIREIREETGIRAQVDAFLTRIFHAYTHFKIEMDVYYCHYISGEVKLNGPIDHKWVRTDELRRYPFPRANLKFMDLIQTPPGKD